MPVERRRISREQQCPSVSNSRKSSRMETGTVTVVENAPAASSQPPAETQEERDRKVSRVRKISDVLTNIAHLTGIAPMSHHDHPHHPHHHHQHHHHHNEGGAHGHAPQTHPESSDEAATRERKISRTRKPGIANVVTFNYHDVLSTEVPEEDTEDGTPRERKISRRKDGGSNVVSLNDYEAGGRYSGTETPEEREKRIIREARERKISRDLYEKHERKISREAHERKISREIRERKISRESRDRKISRSRKISDAFSTIAHLSGIAPLPSDTQQTLVNEEEQPDRLASVVSSRRASINFMPGHRHYLVDLYPDGNSKLDGDGDASSQTLDTDSDLGDDGKKWPQFVASIAANMGAFAFGTVLAWSATGIPSMTEGGELGDVDSVSSWIGSIPTLGAVAACPFAGFALDTLGRRKSMLFLTIPFIIGWLFIGLAQNFFMVLFGRFVTGFCGGAFSIAAPIFTAETADASVRGGLGSLFDLLLSTGMLYIYTVGVFLSWRYQAIACSIIPVAFHVIMYFVPESPRYLVQRDKDHKAEKAIYWLRGNQLHKDIIQKEISDLKDSVNETKGMKMSAKDAVDRSLVLPTSILIGIMCFTTLSGIDAINAYTVSIFESAGSTMDPKISTIIIGVVTMLASIPTAALVDIAGRRILLMASELVMTVSLGLMGFYFHMMRTGLVLFDSVHYTDVTWIPLAALILFIIGYSLGCGPLSMMMIGELLPNRMKGVTSCIVLMTRWFLAFGVTSIFGNLKEFIYDDGTYWLFACICFTGTFFIFFCVPETKGKSLAEIQLAFVKGHKQANIALALNNDAEKSNVLGGHSGYDNKIDLEC
ncbi:Facilitated trehalose transporter Tret1 [Orchesella cincta]|uniref:Facilitated trehalose transporter Tret1 n=1 Tax=Orchesella cincta TaxID=48709 RepID=A0A1D2N871_ORCCI|nr:Facilitated trehalose transporter Tret1 [Orchesella cincta]